MLTVGFRDFDVKQIHSIIEGARVCIEKKLENDMKGAVGETQQTVVFFGRQVLPRSGRSRPAL